MTISLHLMTTRDVNYFLEFLPMSLECDGYVHATPINLQSLLLWLCVLVERSHAPGCNKGIACLTQHMPCPIPELVSSASPRPKRISLLD